MLGVALGLIFVFVTGAPFVLIDNLGVSPDQFGYYQAAIVLAFFFGSVLASRLADHWQAMSLLRLGVALVLIGAALLSVVILTGLITPLYAHRHLYDHDVWHGALVCCSAQSGATIN